MAKDFEHLDFEEQILKQVKKDTESTRKDIKKHHREISKFKKKLRHEKLGEGDIVFAPPFLYSQKMTVSNKLRKAQLRLAQAQLELKILRRQTRALKSKDIRALIRRKHSLFYTPQDFFVKQTKRGFKIERTPKAVLKFAGIKTRRIK